MMYHAAFAVVDPADHKGLSVPAAGAGRAADGDAEGGGEAQPIWAEVEGIRFEVGDHADGSFDCPDLGEPCTQIVIRGGAGAAALRLRRRVWDVLKANMHGVCLHDIMAESSGAVSVPRSWSNSDMATARTKSVEVVAQFIDGARLFEHFTTATDGKTPVADIVETIERRTDSFVAEADRISAALMRAAAEEERQAGPEERGAEGAGEAKGQERAASDCWTMPAACVCGQMTVTSPNTGMTYGMPTLGRGTQRVYSTDVSRIDTSPANNHNICPYVGTPRISQALRQYPRPLLPAPKKDFARPELPWHGTSPACACHRLLFRDIETSRAPTGPSTQIRDTTSSLADSTPSATTRPRVRGILRGWG